MTTNNNIDWDDFLQPSHDEKGHHERIMARVPPPIARQLSIYSNHRAFPYRTLSDAIRHALIRHLRYLSHLTKQLGEEDNATDQLSRLEAMTEVLREEQDNLSFQQVIDRLQVVVNQLLNQGEGARAAQKVQQCLYHVRKIRDRYYREKYESHLLQRFSNVLPQTPRMSLLQGIHWSKKRTGSKG